MSEGYEAIPGIADPFRAIECVFWRDETGRHIARFIDAEQSEGIIPNVVVREQDSLCVEKLILKWEKVQPDKRPIRVRIFVLNKVGDLIP